MAETRNFKMHPKLLLDVIQRQAGSLSKAILEGVMNAVDAKATEVKVQLTEDTLTINDNGTGFESKENITKFFEVFGEPHDPSEGKVYGTFRMGRGQLFAFGSNIWETGTFRMNVDIAKRGLDYDLHTEQKNKPGCQILVILYKPIGLEEIARIQDEIAKWCHYAPIKVHFNDEIVSHDPKDEEWDYSTEQAYIRLKETGNVEVYNLGIHVTDIWGQRFGVGGTIVSKKQLKVNFARNEVMSDCPVWRKITPLVNQNATVRNEGKKSLDENARERVATQLRMGEVEAESFRDHRIFTAVTGRQYSAVEVMRASGFNNYTVAPRGDRVGDSLMRRGIAFVFAQETLARFKMKTVPELLKWIKATFAEDYELEACRKPFKEFKELSKGFTNSYKVLNEDDLTGPERLWLALMLDHADVIQPDNKTIYGYAGRKLSVGLSDRAMGWTDGATYVVISRQFLREIDFDIYGLTALAHVLLHEACHQDPDLETHDHDQSFYERYHYAVQGHGMACRGGCLGEFVAKSLYGLPGICKRLDLKMSKRQMRAVDATTRGTRSAQKIAASEAQSQST